VRNVDLVVASPPSQGLILWAWQKSTWVKNANKTWGLQGNHSLILGRQQVRRLSLYSHLSTLFIVASFFIMICV